MKEYEPSVCQQSRKSRRYGVQRQYDLFHTDSVRMPALGAGTMETESRMARTQGPSCMSPYGTPLLIPATIVCAHCRSSLEGTARIVSGGVHAIVSNERVLICVPELGTECEAVAAGVDMLPRRPRRGQATQVPSRRERESPSRRERESPSRNWRVGGVSVMEVTLSIFAAG